MIANLRKVAPYAVTLAALCIAALGLWKVPPVNAQASITSPSGTFTCLINANYSGYYTKATNQSGQAVNALLVINFNSSPPNTGTLVGAVINNVNDFEKSTAYTETATSTPSPVKFIITQVTPAPNVYKVVSDTPGDVPYYIALVNSGNSLLFMSGPSNDKTHNGVCQKV